MNFARGKWVGVKRIDKAKKKDFIVNKPEEGNDQALTSWTNGDRWMRKRERERENISFSRGKWIGVKRLDKDKKKDFIVHGPKEGNDQAPMLGTNGDRCTREKISLSKSSISKSVGKTKGRKKDTKDSWNTIISDYHNSEKIWN